MFILAGILLLCAFLMGAATGCIWAMNGQLQDKLERLEEEQFWPGFRDEPKADLWEDTFADEDHGPI